jgi:hypothetical protein
LDQLSICDYFTSTSGLDFAPVTERCSEPGRKTIMPKSEYQERKAAGKCVRAGCKRKPKLGPDGKRRSYCTFHNEQNRKNSEAWIKRQAAKPKVIRRKVKPVALEKAA